jgi:hypothetical protein
LSRHSASKRTSAITASPTTRLSVFRITGADERPFPDGQAGYFPGVLFLLFGSSAAGKSYALNKLRTRGIADLAIHDFDEIGVPVGADTAWRHGANEAWLRRGLDYQAEGVDLLLAGQTPLGEVLAAQSAPRFEAISACLIDCSDKSARGATSGTRQGLV